MNAISPRERVGAAVRLRTVAVEASEAGDSRAARLLFALRDAVPHDHSALSRWDPVTNRHETTASFGYPGNALRLINDAMQALPQFAELSAGRIPLRLHDIDASSRRGAIFDDVIAAQGYRDGLSQCLFAADGRYVGMLNLSSYADVDDQSLALVSMVADTLAAAIDPLATVGGTGARVERGEEALVVDPAGRMRALTPGASPDPVRAWLRAGARMGDDGTGAAATLVSGDGVHRVRAERVRAGILVRYKKIPAPGELTLREMEVLESLSTGHSNAAVARSLGVGSATVATHVENILRKTGLPNRTAAAVYAARLGLVVSPGTRPRDRASARSGSD
ncbi:LuxR C-terminal-related transcriptional regulator [Rhodococcus sp. NPDC059234]|uniref:helix-turn-helix transcriptional regulator n=1 Tax=Rhodococcus sp. NPDC059234 TaxID=3346781 RepID=UPI00366B4C91